jgi:hypothetical protein
VRVRVRETIFESAVEIRPSPRAPSSVGEGDDGSSVLMKEMGVGLLRFDESRVTTVNTTSGPRAAETEKTTECVRVRERERESKSARSVLRLAVEDAAAGRLGL